MQARLSLARVAELLAASPTTHAESMATSPPPDGGPMAASPTAHAEPMAAANEADLSPQLEQTEWGPARRYHAPADIDGAPMRWDRPAASLGSSAPSWGAD
jgi:hypothetical protein